MNWTNKIPPFVRFAVVGVIGFVLQIVLIQLLSYTLSSYLIATAAAVEITVLHNFIWHEKFTWKGRALPGLRDKLLRLARFHASNGAISILGNVALMRVFVGTLKVPLAVASLLSVVICSLANFLALDRWIFANSSTAQSKTRTCWDDLPSRAMSAPRMEHK